jgi:hypothetical protein
MMATASRFRTRRLLGWWVTLAALACLLSAGRAAADTPRSSEYLLKAAYLYNFAMFVEWPSDAFRTPDQPIVIGILGTDPFGPALDQIVENKRIRNRRIVIERLHAAQDPKHCHILFITAAEGTRAGEIALQLQGRPVLVVDDGITGRRRGSAVDFVVENNKVGFAINIDVVKRHRLTISSKMLGVARSVR